jgi:hypothetical protein
LGEDRRKQGKAIRNVGVGKRKKVSTRVKQQLVMRKKLRANAVDEALH